MDDCNPSRTGDDHLVPTSPPVLTGDTARSRRQIAVAAWVTVLGAVGATILFLVDPASVVFLPRCPLYMRTGLYCPGCGATRAAHELLHGHWLAALRLNALFTLSLPCLAAFGLYRWAASRCRSTMNTIRWKPQWTWWLGAVIIVFGFARNIPVYPFTLLTP